MTSQDWATALLHQWQEQRHLSPDERIIDDAMAEPPRRCWDDTEHCWLIWDETEGTWRAE